MEFKERISIHFTDLTKTDKKIVSHLLENPESLIDKSVQEAAELMETSPAAIVRFAKKIGYKGLPELKNSLETYTKGQKPQEKKTNNLADYVLDSYRENLNALETRLDEAQLKRIADYIVSAERVKILGFGSSGLSAEQLVYFLMYQDMYTESVTSKTKIYYLSRNLTSKDTLFFYTVGFDADYKEVFEAAKAAGSKVIVFTMNHDSQFSKYATELVVLPSNLASIGFNSNFYQLDNRFMFFIFSEILAAYVNDARK